MQIIAVCNIAVACFDQMMRFLTSSCRHNLNDNVALIYHIQVGKYD